MSFIGQGISFVTGGGEKKGATLFEPDDVGGKRNMMAFSFAECMEGKKKEKGRGHTGNVRNRDEKKNENVWPWGERDPLFLGEARCPRGDWRKKGGKTDSKKKEGKGQKGGVKGKTSIPYRLGGRALCSSGKKGGGRRGKKERGSRPLS